jgi:hypothetical protein
MTFDESDLSWWIWVAYLLTLLDIQDVFDEHARFTIIGQSLSATLTSIPETFWVMCMLRVLVDVISDEQSFPLFLPLLYLAYRSFLVVLTFDALDGSGAWVGDGKLEVFRVIIDHVLYQFRLSDE